MKRFILVIAIIAMVATSVFAFEANPTHPLNESDAFQHWVDNTQGVVGSYRQMQGEVIYFVPNDYADGNYVLYKVWIDWNPNREQWEEEEVTDVYAGLKVNDTGRATTSIDLELYGYPTHTRTIKEGYTYESQYYNDGHTYYVRYDFDWYPEGGNTYFYTRTVR